MLTRNLRNRTIVVGVAIGLLAIGTAVFSQNVSEKRHPNLYAAQTFILQALDKLSEAQKANDFDMGGHSGKAEELLHQAL